MPEPEPKRPKAEGDVKTLLADIMLVLASAHDRNPGDPEAAAALARIRDAEKELRQSAEQPTPPGPGLHGSTPGRRPSETGR